MGRTGGIELRHETGDERVDEILRGSIGLFEAAVPGRIAGYYLAGSYAHGTAVPTSDIDLFYDLRVPREELTAEEAQRCLAVVACVDRISSEAPARPERGAGHRKGGVPTAAGTRTVSRVPLRANTTTCYRGLTR